MKKRSSFILLLEHVHTMEELSDAEFGLFIRAYAAYVESGNEPDFDDRSLRMMWKTIKAFDEMNCKKYASTSEARQEAGRKGASKRWNHERQDIANDSKDSKCHFANGKNSLSVSESESESDSVSKSSSKDSSYVTTTTSLENEFRESIGKLTEKGRKELSAYSDRMGEELVRAVIAKCADLGAHSWAYVRKALAEAEAQGCTSAEEYRKTNPIGAGRNLRVDRKSPGGNDFLKDAGRRRMKKKGEPPPCT